MKHMDSVRVCQLRFCLVASMVRRCSMTFELDVVQGFFVGLKTPVCCADPQSQLLPGGQPFASLAAGVLGAEGLAAPMGCREVLRFDASKLAGTAFPAARVSCCPT